MSQSTVLVVEDDQSLREALHDTLEIAGYTVATAEDGNAAMNVLENEEIGMVISDVQMEPMDGYTLLKKIKSTKGDLPVMLMTAYGDIQKAVQAMREGAVDYLVKPFEAEVLINMIERYIRQPELEESEFIAHDTSTIELKELAKRIADTEATVLISGDSGTGKEVLARFIHNNSPRADKPFVAINCAAIPDNMLEATLFGYEKGAFTGAYNACPGKFEQANGGTLLLDEISEMDLGLQAKLLRVLQEREVERLGGRKMIDLDVRVLATTNRILKEEVTSGNFREDLFYRLNVLPMHIKPLRERTVDILPIAERIIERIALRSGRPIPELSEQAKHYLKTNKWPGNVRELDNMMQRALVLQRGNLIDVDDILFEHIDMSSAQSENDDDSCNALTKDLKTREQDIILESLRESGGSRKHTAEKLGISPRTLRYKLARMREAGIPIPGDIGTETA
ncbi:MAG: sigma-54 dependent transcriptional regulator [Gammaproteobacteria bacterium]|nr:sigma-54 dependent transcriptional regulator [Gammaproteobacteria bacterium]MDH5593773.1 sigma-54 dependent transcriptional regulator [Gammaproteobacteria bacterium]MDH5613708.1 sigma-54 dependent transcriptional regulator [Gammaproteobacteria bacterium]